MTTTRPHVPRQRRPGMTVAARGVRIAGLGCAIALALFVIDVFVAAEALRIGAVAALSASLLVAWIGILTWRMPVLSGRALLFIGAGWITATGLAIWIVLWAQFAGLLLAWRIVTLGLAVSLSLISSGLFLRALLRVRTSPLVGRLLSLLSPLAIVLWILISSFLR